MEEVLDYYGPGIAASEVLARTRLEPGKFFLVSAHREENVDRPANLRSLLDAWLALEQEYHYPIVVSTHPRTRKRLEALDDWAAHSQIRFMKPFGFFDYVKLQTEAFCILSDSGTLTEEASLLNLAAVTIRNAHERPEGMDAGTLIMSGITTPRVLEAVRVVTSQHDRTRRVFPIVDDYTAGPVSKQVVRVVLSYIDYVNRTVWYKA